MQYNGNNCTQQAKTLHTKKKQISYVIVKK